MSSSSRPESCSDSGPDGSDGKGSGGGADQCLTGGGRFGTDAIGAEVVSTETVCETVCRMAEVDGAGAAEVETAVTMRGVDSAVAVEVAVEAGSAETTEDGRVSALVRGIW